MKLLVITQKVDKNDPVLGFFHNWLSKLAPKFERISVICLQKGVSDLPNNVKVFSLGKERKFESKILNLNLSRKVRYALNFYKFIWNFRKDYDAVFVHMNQEYILLGGLFWKLLGKKIYFWRNHPKGSWLTRIAACLSEKIFYTSPKSFTARFKKGILMPVGIDTDKFKISNIKSRTPNSILSLGRISPIKNIDKLIDSVNLLDKRGVDFVLDIVGDGVNPEDFEYYEILKEKGMDLIKKDKLNFWPAVDQIRAIEMYQNHQIFVNLTPSGSMDKTILESMSCGCIPIVANDFYKDTNGVFVTDLTDLEISKKLEIVLKIDREKVENLQQSLEQYVVRNHGLPVLIEKLTNYIQNK